MRVIIFCALAALVGCSDGTVPEAMTATGGAGGQVVAATGGTGGHVMAMMATGGVAGGTGGSGASVDSGPADAAVDHFVQDPRCQAGLTYCSRVPNCVNLQTDYLNCGSCDHGCGVNLAGCQSGVCQ